MTTNFNALILNVIEPLLYLMALYIVNFIGKWIWHTIHIVHGKHLINALVQNYNCRSKLYQLYPSIKKYCSQVGIEAYQNPYGISDNLVNKASQPVIRKITDSLNEAIGVHMSYRGYCYVLFTISKNDKARAAAKVLIDALIKIAAAVFIRFIKMVIL